MMPITLGTDKSISRPRQLSVLFVLKSGFIKKK
jgi:hypothetical protein